MSNNELKNGDMCYASNISIKDALTFKHDFILIGCKQNGDYIVEDSRGGVEVIGNIYENPELIGGENEKRYIGVAFNYFWLCWPYCNFNFRAR